MKKLKILHIGIGSHYTENMTYQENLLEHQNILDGHEVLHISDSEKYDNGVLVESGYEDIILEDGMRLIRLPFNKIISNFISKKIRSVNNLIDIIEEFQPNVILLHNLCFFSVLDVIRYKQKHLGCKLYADTHIAAYNSGRNWFSLHILHKLFYKYLIQKTLPYLEKYLYIGEEEKRFSESVHGVPNSKLEYYPLGGELFADADYRKIRAERRAELGVLSDDILYVHSGKLDSAKYTKELLEAFSSVSYKKCKLVIIGFIPDSQKETLIPLMEADNRIVFLGWKTGRELREYLCACDVYCQPGDASATMQNAICQYCAIMAYPYIDYVKNISNGNMFFVKNTSDIVKCFQKCNGDLKFVNEMKEQSKKCAQDLLDYRKLAKRLYA